MKVLCRLGQPSLAARNVRSSMVLLRVLHADAPQVLVLVLAFSL
jgi:hypothetical protein